MRSYDHVISGTFISTVVVSTTVHLVTSDNEIMVKAGNIIKEVFIPSDMSWILTLLYVVGGSILLWIGMMFPDCDHPNSRIGRVFHIPVAHRTWTHAIWIPAMLAVFTFGIGYFWLIPYMSIATVCFYENLQNKNGNTPVNNTSNNKIANNTQNNEEEGTMFAYEAVNTANTETNNMNKQPSNENYINKAPKKIVDMDREKLLEEKKKLEELLK